MRNLRQRYIEVRSGFLLRLRSMVISMSVCLFVCLSARTSKKLTKFSVHVTRVVAVARSSFDGNEICYVLRFLWMTSRLRIMEEIDRIKDKVCFVRFASWRHRWQSLPSPQLHLVVFATELLYSLI